MTDDEIRQEYAILKRSVRHPEACGALYEKYFDRIFNYIYRQTDDEQLTADLTSQTFLNALRHAASFEYRGIPVSAWIYRIATNEVNKHYRRQKRERVFSIEEEKVRELMEVGNEGWDEELVNKLLDYMKDLPTDMLEVLELRLFEEKDVKESAYILDITESGAKMRTYRGLDRLRKKCNLSRKYDGKK